MSGGGVDIMDRFWNSPPVTRYVFSSLLRCARLIFSDRTIVAAMFVESALVHSGLINYMRVIYFTPLLFKFPPELWRLLSSFILTGGGFNFVFDLYFSEYALLLPFENAADGIKCTPIRPAWS